MTRFVSFAACLALALSAASAFAEDGPSVVTGQFTDRVASGKPVGDAASVAGARQATYWLTVKNPSEPTQLTLVWTVDGTERSRQTLDVGRSASWRTWGTASIAGGKQVDVQILDGAGKVLHEDHLSAAAK